MLFACENAITEEPVPKNEFGVSFEKGVLQFSSLDNYRNMVEADQAKTKVDFINFLDAKQDYRSLRKTYFSGKSSNASRTFSLDESELIETNEFLSSILNEDGIILIGDFYYKVNLSSEKVFVLSANFADQISDLRQEKTTNENLLVFSTNDDVLHLIDEGSKGTINGRTELFCSKSGASSKKDDGFVVEPVYGDYRQDNKVVYQKAGIYFSLQAKTKMQYKSLTGLWVDAGITYNQVINYYVKYEPKCRSIQEKLGTKTDDGPSNELNYRPYESTRGLHKYRYEADFFGQGYWSRIYVIADGF